MNFNLLGFFLCLFRKFEEKKNGLFSLVNYKWVIQYFDIIFNGSILSILQLLYKKK